jgi:hypothetical protein
MSYAQYCRLHLSVADSNRTLVRHAQKMLSVEGRSAAMRKVRHDWLRAMIAEHDKARNLTAYLCQKTSRANPQPVRR